MEVQSIVITCCNTDCGISFAVPNWWNKGKRDTHTWFHCPNGHRQKYMEETEEEKMRRERDIARQQVARAEDEKREAVARAERATKKADKAEAARKRVVKRAAVGVCPCCSRTVGQLARHMKTKHPEFVAEETNVVPIKKAGGDH